MGGDEKNSAGTCPNCHGVNFVKVSAGRYRCNDCFHEFLTNDSPQLQMFRSLFDDE
jgi:ribosomal protein L37AE/L43A